MASHNQPDNITPIRSVAPIDPDRIRRIFGQPLDYPEPVRFTPSRNQPPSFGEKLVAFARRWQFRFGIGCYLLAVGTACYFAFQFGRGL